MDQQALKRWEEMLDAYFHDLSVSEKWCTGVQRLFAEEIFEEEKFTALEGCFNRMVHYDSNPGNDVISCLKKIKAELGFPAPESRNVISFA